MNASSPSMVDRPFGVPVLTLELPVPPSTNNLFANGKKGRFKTRKYLRWQQDADTWLLWQHHKVKPIVGPTRLTIRIPAKTRGDVSNRIKAVEDFLVSRLITSDDKHHHRVSIERDASVQRCLVSIEAVPA